MKKLLTAPALVVLLAVTLAFPVSAQWGGGGLYTENGVEVSVDSRVFAVFAMLNASGFDKDLEGPPPLYRPQHSEARTSTRRRMGRPGSAVRSFAGVVEKNPAAPRAYVSAALQMGAAPKFSAGKGASKLTRGIAKPVAAWFNEEGGGAIYRKVSATQKGAQKKLLKPVAALTTAVGKHVRVQADDDDILAAEESGPDGRVVVVLNDLDAHGTLQRVQVGDVFYVVAGPRSGKKGSDDALVHAVALAYARTLLAEEAGKQGGAPLVKQVWGMLDKAGKKAMGDKKALAADLLACGLLRAEKKGASCAGSPLDGIDGIDGVLTQLDARVAAYIKDDSQLLSVALPTLLAAADAAAPGAKSEAKKP
jgi:hypothetical protein